MVVDFGKVKIWMHVFKVQSHTNASKDLQMFPFGSSLQPLFIYFVMNIYFFKNIALVFT